jgi:hypothetical protein
MIIFLLFLLVFFMMGFLLSDVYETFNFMWVQNRNLSIFVFIVSFVLIYYFLYDYVLFLIYFFSDPNFFN